MGIFDGIGFDPQDYSGVRGLIASLMPSAQGTIDGTASVPLSLNQPAAEFPNPFPAPTAAPIAPGIGTNPAAPIFADRAPADVYNAATYQPSAPNLLDRLSGSVNAAPFKSPSAALNAAGDDEEGDTPSAPNMVVGSLGNKIPVPTFGTPADEPAALPPNSKPAEYNGASPAAAPGSLPSEPFNAVGDHLKAAWQSMRHGGGLIGGLSGLVTGQRDDPQNDYLQSNTTARALIAKGVPQPIAIAAVAPGNGELLKHLIDQHFGPQTLTSIGEGYVTDKNGKVTRAYVPEQKDNFSIVQKGEDSLGRKTYVRMNKSTGEMTPIDDGEQNNTGVPGDASKSGAAYIATLPQNQANIVKGMIDGTIQPPSSFAAAKPYWQQMIVAAKQADPNFDENNWAARHKMSTDLASSGNSSMGGILSNGQSAFKHLADYTNSVVDQGNTSHNFWGGGILAHGQNYVGNKLGGSDTQGKVKAVNDNLGHYGQESTKFYAGTGGGVEERMHALKELNAESTSGEEAAAYAEKERGLMLDRLNEKLKQIRDVYGEEQGNRIIAQKMPGIQASVDKINANIAKLRGEEEPKTPEQPAANVPKLSVGQSTVVNGVGIKKVSN